MVETEEQCGDYVFNHVLEGCRGGVLQRVGCTCGSENPSVAEPTYRNGVEYGDGSFSPDEDGKMDNIRGVTFPETFSFYPEGTSTDLSHVRCIGMFGSGFAFGDLPGVVAIETFLVQSGNPGSSSFGALKYIGQLDIQRGGGLDLSTLATVTELRDLQLVQTSITSLHGLEGLRQVYSAAIGENLKLRSLEGLNNLEYIEGAFSMSPSPIEGLKGLENLRSAGMLNLPILNQDDFAVLSNLEEVRGDLTLTLARPELKCEVPAFLDHVEVQGAIEVDRRAWEDVDLSSCE